MSSPTSKTLRRDLMVMWNDRTDAGNAALDRIMIALHRLQTEGRVKYRQLLGMHGGGGGTSDPAFKALLEGKVKADAEAHYGSDRPTDYFWPSPVPNATAPQQFTESNPFTYTFCWHAEPPFIVWHRALTAEFERLLQEFDPRTDFGSGSRHSGAEALGTPYWAWEAWDGQTLPVQISSPNYTVRSSAWEGFKQGSSFANPFHRWFAPVSVEEQVSETFPALLTDHNCTTRALAFTEAAVPNELAWALRSTPGHPAMWDVVNTALGQPDFKLFATVKAGYGSAQWSIENAHNKFHNHMGGYTLGGVQGPGKQVFGDPTVEQPDYFTGTMAQNQSIFDPVFWLHHGNVERQLCSWQAQWYPEGKPATPESQPPQELMETKLYPWTKPSLLAEGHCAYNTPAEGNTGTFADWFSYDLPYEYEKLLEPLVPLQPATKQVTRPMLGAAHPLQAVHSAAKGAMLRSSVQAKRVMLQAHLESGLKGGDFTLLDGDKAVTSISMLSALGSGCSRCSGRPKVLEFDVSHHIANASLDDATKARLSIERAGRKLTVTAWSVVER